MKIALMTDIEGVAGLVNFADWALPESRYYEQGKVLLTEEVNAAVRGFFDAGAKAALEEYIRNPEKFKVLCPEPPYTYELWLRKSAQKPARKLIRRHPTDIVGMFGAPEEILPEGTYELPYGLQEVAP